MKLIVIPLLLTFFSTTVFSSNVAAESEKTIEDWVAIFKKRETDNSYGGIRIHRLLEADPLPPGLHSQTLLTCMKYFDMVNHWQDKAKVKEYKREFWTKFHHQDSALYHPFAMKIIAEFADVLSPEEALNFKITNTDMIYHNRELLENIQDYSLFTPEHIQDTFCQSLRKGQSFARMKNALRTVSSDSLIKILEMVNWDIEDWEMEILIEARGGLDNLINDFKGHINSWRMMLRFPGVVAKLDNLILVNWKKNNLFFDLIKVLKDDGKYSRAQLYIALLDQIVTHELAIKVNLPKADDGACRLAIRNVLIDKMILLNALRDLNDFEDLQELIKSPIHKSVADSLELLREIYFTDDRRDAEFPYTSNVINGLTLLENIEKFTEMSRKYLTESPSLFTFGFIGSHFAGLLISNYPDADAETIREVLPQFFDNRLSIIHQYNIDHIQETWPDSPHVKDAVEAFNAPSKASVFELNASRIIEIFINEDYTLDETIPEHVVILKWLGEQLKLHSAAAILKRYDPKYVVDKLLPFALKHFPTASNAIQEHPDIFLSKELVAELLKQDNYEILRQYPRILYGLVDYRQFSGANFLALDMDFSKIRRCLMSIPDAQLLKFMKTKQGLIDDPVSFVGSLSGSIWMKENNDKYIQPYFRPAPLILEDYEFIKYFDATHVGPEIAYMEKDADPKVVLWHLVKWAINCEISYLELNLIEPASLDKFKSLQGIMITSERGYRAQYILLIDTYEFNGNENKTIKSDLNDVKKTLMSVPLSIDRMKYALKEMINPRSNFTVFPDFKPDAVLDSHFKKFTKLVKKLAPNEAEKDFWLTMLGVCAHDWDLVRNKINDESIPVYYRSMMKRLLDKN